MSHCSRCEAADVPWTQCECNERRLASERDEACAELKRLRVGVYRACENVEAVKDPPLRTVQRLFSKLRALLGKEGDRETDSSAE